MVSFRDPIHGDLFFDGIIEQLILTEEFQRLSEVKQLGLTDKVYPGANHTRFSHALGACFLAGEIAKRLNVPSEDKTLLQIAALLHDVGHYDFSHALEPLTPYNHEENGKHIILGTVHLPGRKSGQIAVILKQHNIEPEHIVQLLEKKGTFPSYYHSILSSPIIDADRMDYLKRDTYYTGAVIGEIDIQRLLSILTVHPKTKELGILQKGVASLEQFLIARMHMYQQVYLHPDSEAGETMLRKAVASSIKIAEPMMYGDGYLLSRLAEQGSTITKKLVIRIRAGKRSFYPGVLIVDETGSAKHLRQQVEKSLKKEQEQPEVTEQELLHRTKLKDGQLLISYPASTKTYEKHLPRFPVLLTEGEWVDFFDITPIGRTVFKEQISKTMFVVYALPEHAKIVRDAAIKYLEELT